MYCYTYDGGNHCTCNGSCEGGEEKEASQEEPEA